MKALFILYPQNVSKYQEYRMSGSYRFIDTVNNDNEVWTIVNNREEPFTDDDDKMRDDNGRLVWEEGDAQFDFGDYKYVTHELSNLFPDTYGDHGDMWAAIEAAQPWNMDEIRALVKEDN